MKSQLGEYWYFLDQHLRQENFTSGNLHCHFNYCRYPTRDQLTAVAELIVRTFPALKDQSVGSGYVS